MENYIVHYDGRIWSKISKRFLKPCKHRNGYRTVYIRSQMFYVHRLVASEYVSNPQALPYVNHLDGDKTNNHADNLEWCTAAQNSHHAYNVLGKPPTTVSRSITKETVAEIRKLYEQNVNKATIARKLGLKYHIVHDCLRGLTYKSL